MKYTKEELKDLPTLAQGQCCDLKKEEFPYRYWVCRVTGNVTVENTTNGRWEKYNGGCL